MLGFDSIREEKGCLKDRWRLVAVIYSEMPSTFRRSINLIMTWRRGGPMESVRAKGLVPVSARPRLGVCPRDLATRVRPIPTVRLASSGFDGLDRVQVSDASSPDANALSHIRHRPAKPTWLIEEFRFHTRTTMSFHHIHGWRRKTISSRKAWKACRAGNRIRAGIRFTCCGCGGPRLEFFGHDS